MEENSLQNSINKESLWKEVVKFHGHACPGLAIGYQAAILAKEILEIGAEICDEEIVCISETDACSVDALQVLLKATLGTGAMRIDYCGKFAFNLYNRKSNKKVRLVLNPLKDFTTKEEKMHFILKQHPKDLFTLKVPREDFPKKARIYTSKLCTICNENTAENALTLSNNQYICNTCNKDLKK